MDTFGRAGTPAFQFGLRLKFGYYVAVAVWETTELLRIACDCPPLRSRRTSGALRKRVGVFDRSDGARSGRRFGIVHLCRPALNDATMSHELKHVFFWFEREIAAKRFRHVESLDEAMAQEFERCFLALRSHISEERRIHFEQ